MLHVDEVRDGRVQHVRRLIEREMEEVRVAGGIKLGMVATRLGRVVAQHPVLPEDVQEMVVPHPGLTGFSQSQTGLSVKPVTANLGQYVN
jgi:hypothetical protein